MEENISNKDRESPILSLEEKYSPEILRNKIEEMVEKFNCSYIEAVIEICEEDSIELEAVPKLLKGSDRILSSIQLEAEDLHYIPRERNRLTFD